jgi:hypothetical protein
MTRRMSLPGADELFRSTSAARTAAVEAQPGSADTELRAVPDPPEAPAPSRRRTPAQAGERRPSGRERHDDKITVYVSPAELMDLEQARLTLRGDHGMAVDRGRIVREALALVIEDLEARGADSVLVQRLRLQGGR